MPALYDSIGRHYSARRVPDPRIAGLIERALAGAESVVNVGAGSGSYESPDRTVLAIEPSMTMIRQRPVDATPAIQAVAEQLPLRDQCSAAATAFLTLHHWSDVACGLAELRRVARERIVILTWDPHGPGFWLTQQYFPAIAEWDLRHFPALDVLARELGPVSIAPVPVPADCIDGFLGAYWRRPHAYLDPAVRAGISAFSKLPGIDAGLAQLRRDLESGEWHRRNGHLLQQDALDVGYRLVVADCALQAVSSKSAVAVPAT